MIQKNNNYININTRIAEATNKILELFKSGNVPEAIAILTNPSFNIPLKTWSLRNKLISYRGILNE